MSVSCFVMQPFLCSNAIILLVRRQLIALLDVITCDCYCSLPIPYSAVGWSAVCYCGLSESYLLTFPLFLLLKVVCY